MAPHQTSFSEFTREEVVKRWQGRTSVTGGCVHLSYSLAD